MSAETGAGSPRPAIVFVVSSPMSAEAFLRHHIKALSEHYDVHLVVNAAPETIRDPDLRRATLIYAPIERAIGPWADAAALATLVTILRRGRYAAVHSLTPKAGLLAAVAAFIARIPVRVHTFTGQVWATRRGASRLLLKSLDRLIARLDTHVLVDSASQRDFLRREGVLGPKQGIVIAKGSVAGVDPARFRPDAAARVCVRLELDIPLDAIVFLFVGRLTRDKGVLDLARAFAVVAAARHDVYLILLGPDEQNLRAEIEAASGGHADRLRLTGYSAAPERCMAAADVFCLPSHREGFGSVVIEAAAAGVPAIGSRVYGVLDAIEDGSTGLLAAAGSVRELAAAMDRLAADPQLRGAMASAARARALADYSHDAVTAGLVDFYQRALTRAVARAPLEP